MARVCIVCEKGKEGYPVEDDAVILAIRRIKQAFKVAKNNELVVCEDCLEEHRKKRQKYEKDLVMHVVVAAIVLIIFFFVSVFSPSGISFTGILLGILLAAFVVGLSVFNHWPKIKAADSGAAKPKAAPAKKKAKK
jgi:xanthine/uracil permease